MAKRRKPTGRESNGNYEVGYGKPPKNTQFKPGQSGNPRGRPKATKNLKTDLKEELREEILVREGEQARRVSKQRAVVKALVTRTLKGDARSAGHLLPLMMRLTDTGEGAPEFEEVLTDNELEILRAFEDRLRQTDEVDDPIENRENQEDES